MTRQKDLKRIIRDRMKKTGESYTSARAQLVATPKPSKEKKAAPVPAAQRAAMHGVREALLVEKTGHTWEEWVRLLDADGAATLSHRDIGELVVEKYGVPMWWAQSVTVGYERIKGLREPGQRRSGEYEFSKTKTFNVPVTTLFDAWANDASRRRWLGAMEVRRATRPKSIRLQSTDGTSVVVTFDRKGDAKSLVAITVSKLPDRAASDKAKKAWGDRLDALASWFAARKS